MIPEMTYKNINIEIMPSKTFCLKLDKKRITGICDKMDSLKQSIYKMLMTKRYAYEIYNWDYGIELDNLIGMPKGYVKMEAEKRIRDALYIDDRIQNVYKFEFVDIKNDKCSLEIKFCVDSVFGKIDINMEV